jgi:acyl-CoA dehydrogenase
VDDPRRDQRDPAQHRRQGAPAPVNAENDDTDDLRRALRTFFDRECTDERAVAAESAGLDGDLWDRAASIGLPLIGLPEDRGGSGGSLADLLALLRLAGQYAAPLPLSETSLAGWMLATVGTEPGTGPATVVPGFPSDTLHLEDGRLHGVAHAVPWARDARRIVALVGGADHDVSLVALDRGEVTVEPGADLAGMPCDTVVADGVSAETFAWPDAAEAVVARGGLLRAAQMAGALDAVLAITRSYVRERQQFGQPIGRFQAVQHHLVTVAQAAATTSVAVQQAALAIGNEDGGGGGASPAARAAKLVANQEAARGVRAAHQAHGAIGMTQEYRLQLFTRRLQSWRGELGSDRELAQALGAVVLERGSVLSLPGGPSPT